MALLKCFVLQNINIKRAYQFLKSKYEKKSRFLFSVIFYGRFRAAVFVM